jgi:hypothetical protein
MSSPTFNPFLMGCIGALAPEIIRIYNLRLSPTLRWSWSYLLFSFPFILLGGFMAYILEPTTSYAAFYTGVSTPFIVTTLVKDSEHIAKPAAGTVKDRRTDDPVEAVTVLRVERRSAAIAIEVDSRSGMNMGVYPAGVDRRWVLVEPRNFVSFFRHGLLRGKPRSRSRMKTATQCGARFFCQGRRPVIGRHPLCARATNPNGSKDGTVMPDCKQK